MYLCFVTRPDSPSRGKFSGRCRQLANSKCAKLWRVNGSISGETSAPNADALVVAHPMGADGKPVFGPSHQANSPGG